MTIFSAEFWNDMSLETCLAIYALIGSLPAVALIAYSACFLVADIA